MTNTMTVQETILHQLGGNQFIAMTGAANFWADGNTLQMTLPKNQSKSNRLYITLDDVTDTYTMRFFRYTPAKVNGKTFFFTDEKITEISSTDNVYFDQLQSVFTLTTGFETYL